MENSAKYTWNKAIDETRGVVEFIYPLEKFFYQESMSQVMKTIKDGV